MRTLMAGCLFATSLPALAAADTCDLDIQARFIEGAPRDRFVIENRSTGDFRVAAVTLDLTPSAGRLIFDTESGGSGVEAFQLYRGEKGTAVLSADPAVSDGDERLALAFDAFGPGQDYRFSIDVDDRLANSDLGQIRVSGSEMAGAEMRITLVDGTMQRAAFDASNRLRLSSGCL